MAGQSAPCPGCETGVKRRGQALCGSCWRALPADLRADFYATPPYSGARLEALHEVYAWAIRRRYRGPS